jgi:hypothetical protein
MSNPLRQCRTHPPSASEVVAVWERAAHRSSADRGLVMLSIWKPDTSWDELIEVTLGERDQELWQLRRAMFGPTVSGFAACPACGEKLEFRFEVPEFPQGTVEAQTLARTLAEGDYTIEYRAPTTADLCAASEISDVGEMRLLLLSRCMLQAHRQGLTISLQEVPIELVQRIEQRLSEENGAADLSLDLRCARCGNSWEAPFDIAAFLWTEWETLAKSLLLDVVALARAYGWTESEILAMGVTRRRFYLEMVPT